MNNVFSLDLLRAFVAVVDSRSFTVAAQQLHSTQSTVSQKILRLEEAAGQSLLERARHDIRPTDAGEKLLGYARRMLHLHDEAAAAMTGNALTAVFRLGLAEDFAARLVTPALAAFLRTHPNMKLEVTSGLSRELQKGFETGEFDLVMIKQKRGETVGTMHWPEPLSWLESADYPVSHVDPLPLVVFPPNGLYRSDMMEALDRIGRPWHVVLPAPVSQVFKVQLEKDWASVFSPRASLSLRTVLCLPQRVCLLLILWKSSFDIWRMAPTRYSNWSKCLPKL